MIEPVSSQPVLSAHPRHFLGLKGRISKMSSGEKKHISLNLNTTMSNLPSNGVNKFPSINDMFTTMPSRNKKALCHSAPPQQLDSTVLFTSGSAYNQSVFYNSKAAGLFDSFASIISPTDIGFEPSSEWKCQTVSLFDLKRSYFARRNNGSSTFTVKLANAIRIVEKYPNAFHSVGVQKVSADMIKVHGRIFASLMGISSEESLFHEQGGFSKGGFKFVSKGTISDEFSSSIGDVDDFNVVLFKVPQTQNL